MKIAAVIAGSVVGLLLVVGFMYVSASNAEVSLRNEFNAQAKSNESSFDKTWKVISQQASVSQTERESFRKTYVEIMQSTRGVAGNGQLASFFTQSKVDISPLLFAKLMGSIEGQRESFHRDQQHLTKIWQQHNNILTRMPSSWFVGSRPPLELKLVTSSRTSAAFESGEDNDVELFNKKDK